MIPPPPPMISPPPPLLEESPVPEAQVPPAPPDLPCGMESTLEPWQAVGALADAWMDIGETKTDAANKPDARRAINEGAARAAARAKEAVDEASVDALSAGRVSDASFGRRPSDASVTNDL